MASGGFRVPKPYGHLHDESAMQSTLSDLEQNTLAKEVADSVSSNVSQLEDFIIELTEKLIRTGSYSAQASVIEAWQNTYKRATASGAPVEVLDAIEYESEDDTHLFANKTQQQPETPADTPVE